jgi:Holliday junction resolvase
MAQESKLQKQVIKLLEKSGWYVLKVVSSNKSGHPDISAFKDSKAIFLECKSKGKKTTKLQDYRIEELRVRKFRCFIIDDLTTFKYAMALHDL